MSPKGQQSQPLSAEQSTQAVAGSSEPDSKDVKHWTTKRRSALVLEILRGETTAAEAARKHGLTVADGQGHPEGGGQTVSVKPFGAADLRRVRQALPVASLRKICRVLTSSRSAIYSSRTVAGAVGSAKPAIDENLAERVRQLAREHPTFGYRRLWALLRFGDKVTVNLKKVHRLVKMLKLQVKQRLVAPRPRVQQQRSATTTSNERWAMDVTHVYCGAEGWGHLAAVIDCHDRQIVGYEFSLRGRSKEAERALEEACLSRFGTVRPVGHTPTIRSDNGLIFTSRRFREACRFYRLEQEFITPYTPRSGRIDWRRVLQP
jgi:putative transposase